MRNKMAKMSVFTKTRPYWSLSCGLFSLFSEWDGKTMYALGIAQ